MLCVAMLSVVYRDCINFNCSMPSVVMLMVLKLFLVMLCAIILSVVYGE